MVTKIVRLPVVKTRTGLSRSTIYLRVSEGTFPSPVSLGDRAVGWIESEIDDWLAARIETSRKSSVQRSTSTKQVKENINHRKGNKL